MNQPHLHRLVVLAGVVLAIISYSVLSPERPSGASVKADRADRQHRHVLDNYDIREDKRATGRMASYRARSGKTAADVADVREMMVAGEIALKRRVPSLDLSYNAELQHPEVIAPDLGGGRVFLTRPAAGKRSAILKTFLQENAELVGAEPNDIPSLKVAAEHSDPGQSLYVIELKQEIHGIPVFRGKVKAGLTRAGELARVVNNLAPGLDERKVPTDFGDPIDALLTAADSVDQPMDRAATASRARAFGNEIVFGSDDSAPTAEKIYFPTEPGIAVPAWRVLIWKSSQAFYIIVDAATGTVLWRKNLTDEQTQGATYSVYADPDAWLGVAHNPFPLSPGPSTPDGSQGSAISRTALVRIGNEPPYAFNQLGWIPDGGTKTDGNAVQAGLDRDSSDGIDPDGEAVAADRNFIFDYDPFDPNTGTGHFPVPTNQQYPGTSFQQGAITHLFYVVNRFHDETYRLGFDEAAGNFQNINFTGQGVGGDRIRAEAQDVKSTNNANFTTLKDGKRGVMQMYLWDSTSPNIDGSLDSGVVIHELAHGLSNRLHGDSDGLFNDMSRGMGEGWSDFFSLSMLSHPNDPVDGVYTVGGYVTFIPGTTSNNAYYGIRRFPTAVMSSVGGPNNRPHNPLTFADLDQTQLNLSDGAFAPQNDGSPDQVHRSGEIWCSALWEVRARMISRLGWEVGNRRMMQFVVNGMKLSPLSPTFITGRDAIIAAGVATGTPEDVADMWAGFAVRGLGATASIQNVGGTSTGGTGTTRVTQSFSLPNLVQSPSIQVSDESGDNDGYAEPGETVTLTVPITNSTGQFATDTTVHVVGGGTASFGTMAGISTDSRQVSFQVPASSPCGGTISVKIDVDSSLGPVSFTREIFIGKPSETSVSETFDNVTGPALPAGWTAEAVSGGVNFISSGTSPDTPPNAIFALDPLTIGGGTDLTSPAVSVTSPTATVSFRNSYLTEKGWDGGVLEISISGGPYGDILDAGGSFIQNGYNDVISAGRNNPVGSRAGWTGDSKGYITTIVQLPEAANGRIVHLRWRFGADDNMAVTGEPSPGWRIDGISLAGAGFVNSFACSNGPVGAKVSISGRIMAPGGIGVNNAAVFIVGPGGTSRTTRSNALGYYQFSNIEAGHTYTVTVTSKRFRFLQKMREVSDQLTDLDFVGYE